MQQFYTIGLLIVANIFMTFAWYGHLKLQQMHVISDNTPLYLIIILSWLLALPEYFCQPHRLRWERWFVQPHATQGDSGGDFTEYVHCVCDDVLQRRAAAMEPSSGIPVSGAGGVLCLPQVVESCKFLVVSCKYDYFRLQITLIHLTPIHHTPYTLHCGRSPLKFKEGGDQGDVAGQIAVAAPFQVDVQQVASCCAHVKSHSL